MELNVRLLNDCYGVFMGPLILLYWTSANVSSGFHSQSGQPYSLLAEAHVLQYLSDIDLESYIKCFWFRFHGSIDSITIS